MLCATHKKERLSLQRDKTSFPFIIRAKMRFWLRLSRLKEKKYTPIQYPASSLWRARSASKILETT